MSYSTHASLRSRIGAKLYSDLTADTGTTPNNAVAEAMLAAATVEIDIRIGNRYTVPVASPAAQVTRLAGLEEQIAHWMLWVRRGIGDSESAAAAAKVGYDSAIKLLDAISAGDLDLPGVALRVTDTSTSTGSVGWSSNDVVFKRTEFRSF